LRNCAPSCEYSISELTPAPPPPHGDRCGGEEGLAHVIDGNTTVGAMLTICDGGGGGVIVGVERMTTPTPTPPGGVIWFCPPPDIIETMMKPAANQSMALKHLRVYRIEACVFECFLLRHMCKAYESF
jgi:hypothetical protein